MNLRQVNIFLVEAAMRMEARDADDCVAAGGHWVTISGARVCVGKGKGKKAPIIFGPKGLKDPEGKGVTSKALPSRDKRGRFQRAQEGVDKIMGDRDHDFEVTDGKDGNPEFGHPDAEKKVSLGKTFADVFAGMLSYIDVIQALAMKAAGSLASKLSRASEDLYDALEEFSQKGQS